MMTIEELYASCFGQLPQKVTPVAAGGSSRKYYRLEGVTDAIATVGTSKAENEAFISIARHFRQQGLPVADIYAVSDDGMAYLQQDLGDASLFDSLDDFALVEATIAILPDLQFMGGEGLDYSVCYPQPAFDRNNVFFDLNYFKYCFLKALPIEFDEIALEADFEALASVLLQEKADTFMYRDFQSRNVMIHEGRPWFIDFQGGRRGPLQYDLASFLWQAKAGFSQERREELISLYLSKAQQYRAIDEARFRHSLRYFVLFRILQTLGAYGYRGYFQGKGHFLQSVPPAIDNLAELLKTDFEELPYLTKLLRRICRMQFARYAKDVAGRLTVDVYSFSYKEKVPADLSGNGGGYIFDCRAIHNPGRYAQYKKLCGLDADVIKFLDTQSTAAEYLASVYALADYHIFNYIERGFDHLSFSCGCTGGQHRSVYCAQHLAEHIAAKFDVKVVLHHTRLGIEKELR